MFWLNKSMFLSKYLSHQNIKLKYIKIFIIHFSRISIFLNIDFIYFSHVLLFDFYLPFIMGKDIGKI